MSHEEAIKEAYASVPEETVLDCIELRHSTFDTPIRVVAAVPPGEDDSTGITLTHESDAPVDASTAVLYLAMPFGITHPNHEEGRIPQLKLWIDNASGQLDAPLELAVLERESIQITYRQYLASDLTTTQYRITGLELRDVEVGDVRATGALAMADYNDRLFPSRLYYPEDFPGLVT